MPCGGCGLLGKRLISSMTRDEIFAYQEMRRGMFGKMTDVGEILTATSPEGWPVKHDGFYRYTDNYTLEIRK